MKWSQSLDEYPKSILVNDLPLLVLGLVESYGFATEDVLSRELHTEAAQLSRALADLHKDRLIEYGQHFVKLSTRGKWVLDRFDVVGTIIRTFVERLTNSQEEAQALSKVLWTYRDESYSHYLDAVFFVYLWFDGFNTHATIASPAYRDAVRDVVKMALLNDLQEWIRTRSMLDSPKPDDTRRSILEMTASLQQDNSLQSRVEAIGLLRSTLGGRQSDMADCVRKAIRGAAGTSDSPEDVNIVLDRVTAMLRNMVDSHLPHALSDRGTDIVPNANEGRESDYRPDKKH